MIIGLVLLGLTVILMLFGVAQKVFKGLGMAYWLAFVFVGTMIGCCFIPSFWLFGVYFNVAGFIAPAVFSVVLFVLAYKARELWRAVVAASAVMALYVAAVLLLELYVNAAVLAIIAGILCGAAAYIVGNTRLAAVAAAFAGVTVGDIIAAAVDVYVYKDAMRLGSVGAFDAVVLAAVVAVALYEAVAAIRRAALNKSRRLKATEAAEEFDPEEYKRYFGD